MNLRFFKIGLRLGILQMGLLLCQTELAAVDFTVTPDASSNTWVGTITLQINGISPGDTVVVQKYRDANANNVIEAGEPLVEQFNLTDNQAGMVIGGVTNINVPGDLNPTDGAITATLNFPGGDFIQNTVGKYGFVLSSPAGHFAAKTNFFTVTNFPFAQTISGTVVSNSTSVAVPYASVILFPAPRPGDHGPGNPVAGTVANGSGVYTFKVPPGTYVPMAFQSNYVANFLDSPELTLTNAQSVTTNLSLIIATASISGKIVDAADTNIVLSGLFVPAVNDSGFIATGSTDTNGDFTIRVTSGLWNLSGSPQGLDAHGYVSYNDGTNVNAGTVGIVGGFYKATSLFYGSVKDNFGNPMPGIAIGTSDNNSVFYSDGYSDSNGNYVAGVVGGLGSGDTWQVDIDNRSDYSNYIFSQPLLSQNGGTNMTVGKVVNQNFTAILATNQISGNVQFGGTNLVGVGVYAYATISNVNYSVGVDTDTNGNYSFNVANGNWSVGVNQNGGDDSLDNILGSGNYQLPGEQNISINNDNGTADFTIQSCDGVQIITASPLSNGTNGISYYIQLQASSCNNDFTWSLNDPADFPSGLAFDSVGEIYGTPSSSGTYNFSVHVDDNNGHSTDKSFSLYIAAASTPLQITITYLPNATNTTFYSQTLQASGGTLPYNWSIANYSSLPSNLTLSTNGVLSGTPSATVNTYYFDVVVNDAAANSSTQTLSLAVVNPPAPPLLITNDSLPNGNVGVAYSTQLGATGGQPSYTWSYALGSVNLSSVGLTLSSGGLISGTPTTNGLFNFKVQVNDSGSALTNKIFGIIINPKPVLGSLNWLTNRFSMLLNGASNQNYTLQASTNLASTNWISLFITNNAATNSFILTDPNATNKQRFYRILIGP